MLSFNFDISSSRAMDSSHQARLNGVVLLKIHGAVPEILMKTCFVQNGFSLISRERLRRFSKGKHLLIRLDETNP